MCLLQASRFVGLHSSRHDLIPVTAPTVVLEVPGVPVVEEVAGFLSGYFERNMLSVVDSH